MSGPPITTAKKRMTPAVYDVLRRDAQDMCRLYRTEKPPAHHVWAPSLSAEIEYSVLAPSYSCLTTTIASTRLNYRVRNENGCDPGDKALARNTRYSVFKFHYGAGRNERTGSRFVQALAWLQIAVPLGDVPLRQTTRTEPSKIPFVETKSEKRKIRKQYPTSSRRCVGTTKGLRDSHNSFREFCRRISTPRLHALLRFHLVPINVVISHEPQTIPDLGVGFPLRCFQRLSVPDIATGRCTWRYSPQTRGQFISVLSY